MRDIPIWKGDENINMKKYVIMNAEELANYIRSAQIGIKINFVVGLEQEDFKKGMYYEEVFDDDIRGIMTFNEFDTDFISVTQYSGGFVKCEDIPSSEDSDVYKFILKFIKAYFTEENEIYDGCVAVEIEEDKK